MPFFSLSANLAPLKFLVILSLFFALPGESFAQEHSEKSGERAQQTAHGLGLLKCAFVTGIDEAGPRFLNISSVQFNRVGIFQTSDEKTFQVALNINRKVHRIEKGVPAASRAERFERVLESLATSLEKVSATKVVVFLDGASGKAVMLRRVGLKWSQSLLGVPKDQSPEGLQRWLMSVYGYSAVVREVSQTGRVTLRAAPLAARAALAKPGSQALGRQGVVLASAPGVPLAKDALSERPVALLSCQGEGNTLTCETLLSQEEDTPTQGGLVPGTPVWFPEAK